MLQFSKQFLKLKDNKFADLTNEEFKSTYMGFGTKSFPQTGFRYRDHGALPESKDWRKDGAVSGIKD